MIALALPILLALLATGPTPSTTPGSPLPTGTAVPTSALPSLEPAATSSSPSARVGAHLPAPLATVGPATAPYLYRFVPGQPAHPRSDQPQIFAVFLNAKVLHSAGPIDIRVITSANVVKVISGSNGRSGPVAQVGAGDFQAHSQLPKLPRIATGIMTTLNFTAISADRKSVTVGVPIQLL